ncbi:putative Ran interacting Mog1 protein [Trypanosoma vivax]|uniref:Putative Ran-binding protein n=1 Tax=Trypanosoma vivax (strain Y486) TaxID=1055687 RepID=G0U0S2_TRYVY|nr:putative Ran-binding protein [Trypanosoma vivax]KAH8608912.1 putative Ran interacting Mog1 protein [Trypanosoma vivax]CCC49672.1 putative Ran-binding protein [Trypanosoma vivax Y486]
MQEKTVPLYGGAITCTLPLSMVDVSELRQVPDTQEVYTEVETGTCVIFELLARERGVGNEECGAYFYADLARANGCGKEDFTFSPQETLCAVDYPQISGPSSGLDEANRFACAFACLVTGRQRVSKYTNEKGKENDVLVVMAVLRFEPPVSTDIIISISAPQRIHPESSEARVVQRLRSDEEVMAMIRRLLATFKVKDWGLFVLEE